MKLVITLLLISSIAFAQPNNPPNPDEPIVLIGISPMISFHIPIKWFNLFSLHQTFDRDTKRKKLK